MTNQIERVEPTVIDGIEFYSSNLTEETGLSYTGIAILSGVTSESISALINNLSDSGKTGYKGLEHLRGKDLACQVSSNQQAKVIKDEYAADIISYYADKGNVTAKKSIKKFQTIGIRSWIKTVTGNCKTNDFALVQQSLNQILDVLTTTNARLTSLEQKTAGYIKASIELSGLKEWMEAYAQNDEDTLTLPDAEIFTLSEYLWVEKRLKFEKPAMSKFALKVSYVYKTMAETQPFRKRGVSSTGYQTPLTNAYNRRDFPLLDIAFKQTVLEL